MARSYQIVWTVIYKGHAMLPINVLTTRSIRLIFVIATRCEQKVQAEFQYLWENFRGSDENPVGVAKNLFDKFGWGWPEPFKIIVETDEGMKTVALDTTPWKEAMHIVREGMRYKIQTNEQLHSRWDLKGLRNGIDYDKTRQNLGNKKLSWLQRGMLRTIMSGSCWTPGRMMKAGCLSQQQATCVHCTQNEIETLGHRFWSCPRWSGIRASYSLLEFSESSWPRALTRCGVCPKELPLTATKISDIQLMMVDITMAASEVTEAQKQFVLARRTNSRKNRQATVYRSLVENLVGHT